MSGGRKRSEKGVGVWISQLQVARVLSDLQICKSTLFVTGSRCVCVCACLCWHARIVLFLCTVSVCVCVCVFVCVSVCGCVGVWVWVGVMLLSLARACRDCAASVHSICMFVCVLRVRRLCCFCA